ncbi:hypothetical protein ACXU4B_07270 [Dyella soli]|uniref:SHOCT domain-containing protein n=1 Tax=Dyella soli TaxID=522319 RepID=A0A4R0YPL8_9GAMM|nr:hypothetical protein [Dyella soli]TCI10776.1 hypothetical protein EZM97_18170 [Dyella soli]
MNRAMTFGVLLGACVGLAGCGSSTRVVQNNDTCGKQMTDLQDALNSGAMSQHEYNKARRVAVERCESRDNR